MSDTDRLSVPVKGVTNNRQLPGERYSCRSLDCVSEPMIHEMLIGCLTIDDSIYLFA